MFTANGRQCIAAALAAMVPPGGRCGVEALTYPFIKGIAARLGVTLVPLAMDEHGVRPDAVQKAHREVHLPALYIQPIIQNPLGITMPPGRRADLLRVVEKLGLTVIEDFGLRLSRRRTAACRAAPDRCILHRQPFQESGAGTGARFHRAAAAFARERHGLGAIRRMDRVRLCVRGRAAADGRRHRFRTRQAQAHRCAATPADRSRMLAGFEIQANQILPSVADAAAALAVADLRRCRGPARHRIDSLDDLCGEPRHAPNAVRLALAAPPIDQLDAGLRMLAGMLSANEEEFDSTE